MYFEIPGIPDLLISKTGDVFSVPFKSKRKLCIGSDGYYRIRFRHKNLSVHRLVAITFLPIDNTRRFVNHKDGNKLNNNLENLEWVTPKENSRHAVAAGLMNLTGITHKRSEESPNAKPILQYSKEGEFIREWACAWDVTRSLGIQQQNISKMCTQRADAAHNGKKYIRKSVGGFVWRFK